MCGSCGFVGCQHDMRGRDPKRPRQEMLTSPQLDHADRVTRGYLGFRNMSMVGFSRNMSSLRQVTPPGPKTLLASTYVDGTTRRPVVSLGRWGDWGALYHKVVYQRYVNVPLWAASGTPLRFTEGRNRQAFRRTQPNVRIIALSEALKNSMQAVARARGDPGS
jgi:hypothetical protein